MRRTKRVRQVLVLVIGVALSCGGCALQQKRAQHAESMLTAAGFKVKVADTPEQLAALEAKPQRTIKFLQRHGQQYFAFTDAKGCRCTYLGDQAAYQKYLAMLDQERIAKNSPDTVAVDQDAAIVEDDGIWESWGGDTWGGGND